MTAEELAKMFVEVTEELAPAFGYEGPFAVDREFHVAVCKRILAKLRAEVNWGDDE